MSGMNKTRVVNAVKTHGGAPVAHENPERQLRRSVMSCMLWENSFYESGVDIAERIKSLVANVSPEIVSSMAIEARQKMNMRHAPLWIIRAMLDLPTHKKYCRKLIPQVVQRADELSELIAMYWPDGNRLTSKTKMPKQLQRGLADAFANFNAYELAKYNRDKSVQLRDVMFLCHPKPVNQEQAEVFKKLAENTLESPDTWEVALSSGANKKETFERLINEKKLGGLAMLRNLRNMTEAGVDPAIIRQGLLSMKTDRVLPFRFIAAARYAPQYEPELESAMMKSMYDAQVLSGRTTLLVDVSGSMDSPISNKSDMARIDAACGLAVLLREISEVDIFTFSGNTVRVPSRRGFALRDAIKNSQPHGSTFLGKAVDQVRMSVQDRLIVISDEQSHDRVDHVKGKKCYMLNVASYQNGVGFGAWNRIDGWSDSVIKYIAEMEKSGV
jgi:hypothetical protein